MEFKYVFLYSRNGSKVMYWYDWERCQTYFESSLAE